VDKILERFRAIQWHYAPRDEGARSGAGCDLQPSQSAPTAPSDGTGDWQDIDRAILGDFLGYLSRESYERAGFFSSALVVSKQDGSPGEGFYSLLRELGLIAKSKTDKAMFLWADHVAKAHAWYSKPGGA
jgi:hypothetical protein